MEITESNTLLNDQLSQQHGEYMHGVEIIGESRYVKRIKKLFENSSVKIKVVQQERPSAQEPFTWDEDTTEPLTEIGDVDLEPTFFPTRNIYGSSDDNSSGLGKYSHTLNSTNKNTYINTKNRYGRWTTHTYSR